LTGLSLLLVTEQEAGQSAKILDIVERLLEEEGGLDEIFRLVYDQSLAATKEMLTKETFNSEIASGRSMEMDANRSLIIPKIAWVIRGHKAAGANAKALRIRCRYLARTINHAQ
jgi:hypothetical protein